MVMIEVTLETLNICLGWCLSMKNVGIVNWSLMMERLPEILTRRSLAFHKPIDVHSVKNTEGECFFNR